MTPILQRGQSLAPVLKTYNLEHLSFGITEYPSPIRTGKWHAHDSPSISFVLEGGNIEYRKGEKIQRECNSINFYHAYETHKNIYKVFPSRHLSLEIAEDFLKCNGLTESHIKKVIEENLFGKLLFLKIIQEIMLNDLHSKDTINALFLELVHTPSNTKANRRPQWVNLLTDLINDNWNQTLSLQQLSREVGVHPITISKNFRKYYLCTLGEYMRKIKVERSLLFVRGTNQSLTEVAYKCGFSDQSHFTRTFKTQTGFLPKEFKQL